MFSDVGEFRCDKMLGIQKMPKGYELWLNYDRTHFYWVESETERESCIHWNKWAIYRGAKQDSINRQIAATSE